MILLVLSAHASTASRDRKGAEAAVSAKSSGQTTRRPFRVVRESSQPQSPAAATIGCPAFPTQPRCYAVRMVSDLSPEIAACAAASRAIGTRYGEQET